MRTGKSTSVEWAWDLGNPETTKFPPEGETYTKGTPNYWSSGAYDPELDMVYLPLGNATPDFWAGHRIDAADEYGASVVALHADTGREAWHFQTTHKDTWDYDIGTPPALVEERPVPREMLEGDDISPTQPWSVGMPQIAPPTLREEDMWGATMFDQLYCRISFRKLRYEGP